MQNRLTVFLIMFLPALLGLGRDIYVTTNGAGGGDPVFGAWEHASSNIQWAVNAGTNGDTVWISNGVYVLTNQVTVISNLTISGLSTNARPVMDGNNSNRCFYFTAGKTSVLANLFITRGSNNSSGGGVYMSRGTVLGCVFSNNTSLTNGGGMFFDDTTCTVQRCTFIGNRGWRGGGLYLRHTSGNSSVDQCLFYTNIAYYNGGGMDAYNSGADLALIVTNCVFISNIASNYGGGLALERAGNLATGCILSSNVSYRGGGAYVDEPSVMTNCYVSNNIANSGAGLYTYTATVKNCLIARNKMMPTVVGLGAGVYMNYGGLIQDCIIEENTGDGSSGGGIYLSYSPAIILNCLIRNNSATNGGGIRIVSDNCDIGSCTIVSNYASGLGGGIYIASSVENPKIANCIIYQNTCADAAYSNFYCTSVSSTYSNNCTAPEITIGFTTNNIYTNPQFVNWPGGNYRLGRGSPCVNTGVNRDWMTNAVDLDGRMRIRYGTVDMGVYERINEGTIYKFR